MWRSRIKYGNCRLLWLQWDFGRCFPMIWFVPYTWSVYVPENLPKIRTRKNTLMSWAMANAWIWLSPRPFHSSVVFLFKWENEVKKVKREKNWATWQILPLFQSFWKRYFFSFYFLQLQLRPLQKEQVSL